MHRRSLARAQALILAVLLGITSSGLPSHHHGDGERTPVLTDPDHHGHGVLLVDQTDRLKSRVDSMVALPALPIFALGFVPREIVVLVARSSHPMMGGRAPPVAQPRAPPVSD